MISNIDGMQGLIPNQELPYNPATGRRYTGANMIALAAENRPQNMWLTYSQVAAAGGKVLNGEHGAKIQIWSSTERGENGETIRLEKPKLSYATVFNIEQTTLTNMNAKTPERMDAATFMSAFNIEIDMSQTARPRYDNETDTISVPPPNRFPSMTDYHRVVVEQIAARQDARHSNEPAPTPGTPQAAEREMKIKIAAAVIGDALGVGHTADLSNGIYSNKWKKMAANHPRDVLRTAATADTIAFAVMQEARKITQGRNEEMPEQAREARTPQPISERINLRVPFAEKDQAKEAGCRWDKEQKTWYAPPGTDIQKIAHWRENTQIQATTPREELINAMTAKGMIISDNHPIMDGKSHRISVHGDDHAKNERSGFYVAHSDGVPAGYLKNNRTGEETKWRATGFSLTDDMKATLAQTAREKYDLREEEITKRQEQVANRLTKSVGKLEPVTEPTQYMQDKGIGIEPGIYKTVDKSGEVKLAVPLTDIHGKVWSMTTIAEDGVKTYAKDGKKHGSFHVVGGIDALKDAPAIIMAEGYATAVSLKNGLNTPVVAAMDSGNLLPVGQELRKAFPEKAIVVCGDDDRKLLDNPKIGKNIGKDKAMEAALAVGGSVVFPIFPKGTDNSLSDFNDLATKTPLGVEGLRQQTQPAIARAIANAQAQVGNTLIAETIKQKEQAREGLEKKETELKREKEDARGKAQEQKPKEQKRGLAR